MPRKENMINDKELIQEALEARKSSYSPYSHFAVGAALLCSDGQVIRGANVENASFGGTICAERSAFLAAISMGKRDFEAVAIVGAPHGDKIDKICAPCGICRQFMSEFCGSDFKVVLYDGEGPVLRTLGELLPDTFSLKGDE